jgi:hypothetical protein
MIAAEFYRSGEEERDHQLEPSGKRTRQDQSQGENASSTNTATRRLDGKGGEDRACVGGAAASEWPRCEILRLADREESGIVALFLVGRGERSF